MEELLPKKIDGKKYSDERKIRHAKKEFMNFHFTDYIISCKKTPFTQGFFVTTNTNYTTFTFFALGPFGPSTTSKSTVAPT